MIHFTMKQARREHRRDYTHVTLVVDLQTGAIHKRRVSRIPFRAWAREPPRHGWENLSPKLADIVLGVGHG